MLYTVPWLCVWGAWSIIFCLFQYMSRKSWVLFSPSLCCFMMCSSIRLHYCLIVVFVCLQFTYIISLPLSFGLTWRHCTHKMLVRHLLSNMCLGLSQFSQLLFMQYMGLCVFSLPISFVMILKMRALRLIIIMKSESLAILNVTSWNNGMRYMSCYVITPMTIITVNFFVNFLSKYFNTNRVYSYWEKPTGYDYFSRHNLRRTVLVK